MRRQATPLLVGADSTVELEQVSFGGSAQYDEAWIQQLVDQHPSVLPIANIEPAFEDAVPVCRELPLPAGYLDNLLVTPAGDLVLVECKLWRNPDSRRKVIAQIIDYAKDLQGLGFEGLQNAVRTARADKAVSLYKIVDSSLSESDFCDNVSRNLHRSRALLLVVGDGITEEVERLTEFLQQHAGLQFSLALVELAVYRHPESGLLVVPSVPMRTDIVTRGIVEVTSTQVAVRPNPGELDPSSKGKTLTETEFFEELDALRQGTSAALFDLFRRGSDLGLEFSVKKALSVRVEMADESTALVLVVARDGAADPSYLSWGHDRWGSLAGEYLGQLARRIPGAVFRPTKKGGNIRLLNGPLTVWDVLANSEAWLEETRRFRRAYANRQSGSTTLEASNPEP